MTFLKNIPGVYDPTTDFHALNLGYIQVWDEAEEIFIPKKLTPETMATLGYKRVIINLSAAQLRGGNSPIEIIPALGEDKYPDYFGTFKITGGSEPFSGNDQWYIGDEGPGYCGTIFGASFNSTEENVKRVGRFGSYSAQSIQISNDASENVGIIPQTCNTAICFSTWFDEDLSQGNGTGQIELYYREMTF